jgi:hypothetical protein
VDEGLCIYFEKLLDAGISATEIEQMVRHNPAQLLGAKERVTT